MTNHRGATRHDILPGGRYPGQDLYDVLLARCERAEAEVGRLRAELAHPAYEFVRQAFADGRTITRLIPPQDCLHGIRYAGFYCQDYTGPTEGVAPPDSPKAS